MQAALSGVPKFRPKRLGPKNWLKVSIQGYRMGRKVYLNHHGWSFRPCRSGRNREFCYENFVQSKKCFFIILELFLLVLSKLSTSNVDFGPINCSNHNVSSGLNIWNELENRFLTSRMCFGAT